MYMEDKIKSRDIRMTDVTRRLRIGERDVSSFLAHL